MRSILAFLFLLAGTTQICLLWLRPLTVPLMLVALMGCVYTLISIGLFGVSRFTLVAAAVVPALRLGTGFGAFSEDPWQDVQTGMDLLLSLSGALLSWRARHTLSV